MVNQSIRIFVDSDVVISSLISDSGAAYKLLHDTDGIELYVSNFSIDELQKVVNRLRLDSDILFKVLSFRLSSAKINQPYKTMQMEFARYVMDIDDAHIVAGAKQAKANFLVSYNIRHFRSDKLTQDFQIVLLTPGLFLQYLRSL